MMKEKITARFVQALRPAQKQFDVRDTILKGFLICVFPSGRMSYTCDFRFKDGRRNRIAIGDVNVLSVAQARGEAIKILAQVAKGEDPTNPAKGKKVPVFLHFVKTKYQPYVETHLKAGRDDAKELLSKTYVEFHSKRLDEITPFLVEKWRSRRKQGGTSNSTINRGVDRIRAMLSKAVSWEFLDRHPIKGLVKPLKVSNQIARCLSADEELTLRCALRERDVKMRAARKTANDWRRERNYPLLPDYQGRFADHLEPLVLLSLNLGARRGELLAIEWEHINLDPSQATVTFVGDNTKSGKSRTLPLNMEALQILCDWKVQTAVDDGYVFRSRRGSAITELKTSWRRLLNGSGISKFRWHDLRHTFASNLACKGIDLNIIRALLGHSDMRMTLRYAHLREDTLRAAVNRLRAFGDVFPKKEFSEKSGAARLAS